MPRTPPPPEEIAHLMQFIAEKAKHVTSPMKMSELCKQFKAESGSLLSMGGLEARIRLHRLRIHEMNEFNMDTKVKMLIALSAPIDARFLIEMKKLADVEVDDQQRIIHYKPKEGGLELSAKYLQLSINQGEKRNREIIRFLAMKSETVDIQIPDQPFLKEFKEITGFTDSLESLRKRYRRVKEKIYQSTGIDKNTKIKMMFISNVKLPKETLKELQKNAIVEVDEKGRIIKYKGNDGSLELEENHEKSTSMKVFYSDRWQNICEKIDEDESDEDEKEETNWQKDYEKKRIELVKFLIKRTKDAKYPMSIHNLAAGFKTEFNNSDPLRITEDRILSFRLSIHEINQFDTSTKVKMIFALSAPVDAKYLKEIQKGAFVELDEMKRIKTYIANDGSLELEQDYLLSAKANATIGSMREKNSQSTSLSQNLAAIQKWRKRVRQISEEDDDGEPLKVESDAEMDFTKNHAYSFDYDPSSHKLEMGYIPIEKKPETLIEIKTEVPEGPSTSNSEYRYEERFFDYDPPTYEKNLEYYPGEKKPENFTEVKLEVPEEPSTSNLEYHYEDILTEPKPE